MARPSCHSVVDLTLGVNHPLSRELRVTLNPIQWRMRSPLGVVIFLLISFGIGIIPITIIPFLLYSLHWTGLCSHWLIRRIIDLCVALWMTVMTAVYESMFGIKIRTFGYSRAFKRRSLIIMNHVSYFDWMFFWSVSDRQGDLSYWKVIAKRFPIRNLPVLGQCVQMACYIFLARKWETDKLEFRNKLYYFNAINYPVQLLLFPEGGDFNPRTKARSDLFARNNNLPLLSYCFHPRTTGFKYTVNALRDGGLDAVYDITIAYPDVLSKSPVDVLKGYMPREVHYHINQFDDKDLPKDQDKLEQWLSDRWLEKEERLKEFYACKEFREGDGERSIEVRRPKNTRFLLLSFLVLILLNVMVCLPLLCVPYFWLFLMVGILFLCIGHREGLGNIFMRFKQKEIEEAVKKSEYNSDN